jgi:hypothetical protein
LTSSRIFKVLTFGTHSGIAFNTSVSRECWQCEIAGRCGWAKETGLRFRCCQQSSRCRKSKSHETEPAPSMVCGLRFRRPFLFVHFLLDEQKKMDNTPASSCVFSHRASLFPLMSLVGVMMILIGTAKRVCRQAGNLAFRLQGNGAWVNC